MNRNLVIAAVAVAALAVAAYLLLRGGDNGARDGAVVARGGRAGSAASGSGASGASSAPVRPRLPDEPADPSTPFQRARAQAMSGLQTELTNRIAACAPSSNKPPRPRPVRFLLEWRAEASTPDKQQYIARDVTLVGGNADDITPEVRTCLEQLRGMPVVLFVSTEQLPPGDRTMDETFELPLP